MSILKDLKNEALMKNKEQVQITNVTHAAVSKDKVLNKAANGEWYEFKGDYIYEFKDLNYKERAIEPGMYKLVPHNYGVKQIVLPLLKDKAFDKMNTLDLKSRIEMFLDKVPKLKSFELAIIKRGIMLHGKHGCHAKDTKILMFDGSVKKVQDIKVGDLIMGPDSSPREVLKLHSNKQRMVKIIPTKGEDFVVNLDHILHLTPSGTNTIRFPINIKVSDYLNQSVCFQERFKLTKTGVEFNKKNLKIDPYILGLWLGDGSSDSTALTTADKEIAEIWINYGKQHNLYPSFSKKTSSKSRTITLSSVAGTKNQNKFRNLLKELNIFKNKHIPFEYLTSDREDRLKLLAGLIDTDGHRTEKGHYTYVTKLKALNDGVLFLARSLGLAANSSKLIKAPYINGHRGQEGEYYSINIYGNTEELPIVLERKKPLKRKINKNPLRIGFKTELMDEDTYYGFTVDKDHLYLTADFMIHHNSGKTHQINTAVSQTIGENGIAISFGMSDVGINDFIEHLTDNPPSPNIDKLFVIIEDLGGGETPDMGYKVMGSQDHLLAFLDGNNIPEAWRKIPIIIFSTTNYPELFLANIIDRPGRFDEVIEVPYPDPALLVEYAEDFMKEPLTDFDKREILKGEISIAHIKDACIRKIVYNESIHDTIKKMRQWSDKVKATLEKKEAD